MKILEKDLNQGNEIKNIDFYGGEILGVKTPEGKVYMGVRKACRDIGLTEDQAGRQIKNIQIDLVLNKGVSNLTIPTQGGIQEVIGIEKGFMPLWLAKISITPNMQKENPKAVERLVKYQLEAKDVLEKAFIKKQPIIPENLSPELQMFGQMFQAMVNIELGYTEMAEEVAIAKEEISAIKGTIIADTENWRDWINKRLKAIGAALGDYRRPRVESYVELEKRAKCNLERRLNNKIENMKLAGASKKAINNTNYLDVIGEDVRLKEIYTAIVKEMNIKYL